MDIATVIGIIAGIVCIIGTILFESSLMTYWNIPALAIVVGGGCASVCVGYPIEQVGSVIRLIVRIFIFKLEKPEQIVANLVEISNKARKGGLLSIESDINNTKDPYLASALQMTVDGVKTPDIAGIMQNKMAVIKEEQKLGAAMFATLGSAAPAFGMIGTLIGLVQMLANLDDPAKIGPSMSVAMIATLYGAVLANFVCLPTATKLKIRCNEEIANMNIIYEGIISIREGEHPKLMEEKLGVYLHHNNKS